MTEYVQGRIDVECHGIIGQIHVTLVDGFWYLSGGSHATLYGSTYEDGRANPPPHGAGWDELTRWNEAEEKRAAALGGERSRYSFWCKTCGDHVERRGEALAPTAVRLVQAGVSCLTLNGLRAIL